MNGIWLQSAGDVTHAQWNCLSVAQSSICLSQALLQRQYAAGLCVKASLVVADGKWNDTGSILCVTMALSAVSEWEDGTAIQWIPTTASASQPMEQCPCGMMAYVIECSLKATSAFQMDMRVW